KLRQVTGLDEQQLLPTMKLSHHLTALAQKTVWMLIGDQHTRVYTQAALSFMHDLLLERERQPSKAQMEFNAMYEARGHTTPKGSVERAIAWLSEITNTTINK